MAAKVCVYTRGGGTSSSALVDYVVTREAACIFAHASVGGK